MNSKILFIQVRIRCNWTNAQEHNGFQSVIIFLINRVFCIKNSFHTSLSYYHVSRRVANVNRYSRSTLFRLQRHTRYSMRRRLNIFVCRCTSAAAVVYPPIDNEPASDHTHYSYQLVFWCSYRWRVRCSLGYVFFSFRFYFFTVFCFSVYIVLSELS